MSDRSKSFRQLMHYAAKIKYLLFFGIALMVIRVYFTVKAPLYVSYILDNLIKDGVGITKTDEFWRNIYLYFAFLFISGIISYAANLILNRGANRAALYIQEDCFDVVQKMPISKFDKIPAGKISSRITNDTRQVRTLFQVVLARFIGSGISMVGIVAAIAELEPELLIFMMIPLPLLYLLVKDYRIKTNRIIPNYRRRIADINAMFNETIQLMNVIRAFNHQEKRKREFEEMNGDVYKYDTAMTKLIAYSSFNAVDLIKQLTIIIIMTYFGVGIIMGRSSSKIGLIFVFITYVQRFFSGVQNCINNLGNLERSIGAAGHIFEFMRENATHETSGTGENAEGDIEFKDVHFSYVEGEEVLKGINFRIKKGETVGIVGRTGSGKTSIINLIFKFYNPDRGVITIGGKDISKMSSEELRKNMAIVIQDPFLFMGTVKSNVALEKDAEDAEIVEALERVGAGRFIEGLREGIHTRVSEQGMTYSSGERQLISFARALLRDPEILVLDEATSNIDTETEEIIQKGIQTLKQGRTCIIIAHRLSTIKNADKIIVLDNGRIKETGNHEELLKLGGIYAGLWQKSLSMS